MTISTNITLAYRTNPTDRARFAGVREDLKGITETLADDAIMRNAMTGQVIKVSEVQRMIDIMYMLAHSQCPLWEVLTEDEIVK